MPRSSSCLRFAPAVTDTHARLGYSLPARFERRAFHPLGKHTAFRTHTRIFHRNAHFSRRDFLSDRSNGQKSMSFIGLQAVRASWAERSREKAHSVKVTACSRPVYSEHSTTAVICGFIERSGEICGFPPLTPALSPREREFIDHLCLGLGPLSRMEGVAKAPS